MERHGTLDKTRFFEYIQSSLHQTQTQGETMRHVLFVLIALLLVIALLLATNTAMAKDPLDMAEVVSAIKANNTVYQKNNDLSEMWVDGTRGIWYRKNPETATTIVGINSVRRGVEITLMEISRDGILVGVPNAGSNTGFDSRRNRRVFRKTLRRLLRETAENTSPD